MSGQATGWVLRHGPRRDTLDRDGRPYGERARGMRAVLVTIADAANRDGEHAHPGIDAMVDGSLYSRRQVLRVLDELLAEGWLAVEQAGGGRGIATVYALPGMTLATTGVVPLNGATTPPNSAMEPGKGCHDAAERVPPATETVPRQAADQGLFGPNGLATVLPNGTTQRATEGPDPFAMFWQVYPRKEDKGAARRAYERLMRACAPASLRPALAGVIAEGAARYRDDPNRESRYTKLPATWLNAEGWLNGRLPERGRAGSGPPRQAGNVDQDRDGPSGAVQL